MLDGDHVEINPSRDSGSWRKVVIRVRGWYDFCTSVDKRQTIDPIEIEVTKAL